MRLINEKPRLNDDIYYFFYSRSQMNTCKHNEMCESWFYNTLCESTSHEWTTCLTYLRRIKYDIDSIVRNPSNSGERGRSRRRRFNLRNGLGELKIELGYNLRTAKNSLKILLVNDRRFRPAYGS